MKTKIFLMVIIACLLAYITFDSSEDLISTHRADSIASAPHIDSFHEHDISKNNHIGIPTKIKQKLCIDDNEPSSCRVNLSKNLEAILLDENGNLLAEEIATVLDSINFQELVESLSTQKESQKAIVREEDFQRELVELTRALKIESPRLYCSEQICAMTIQYEDVEASKAFFKQFFNKSNKGNIFLSQQQAKGQTIKIERVMFFPENRNGIIIPELD